MGEKVKLDDEGAVETMAPVGSRKDRDARIYPFKLHRAMLPVTRDTRWIVPLAVEECFSDGDVDKAVHEGGQVAYGLEDFEYDWVPVKRWMGIFHGVRPAEHALKCLDCHDDGGRLDWKALGYNGGSGAGASRVGPVRGMHAPHPGTRAGTSCAGSLCFRVRSALHGSADLQTPRLRGVHPPHLHLDTFDIGTSSSSPLIITDRSGSPDGMISCPTGSAW